MGFVFFSFFFFFFYKKDFFKNILKKKLILSNWSFFTLLFFAVPIHLEFEGVDPSFMYGMLFELSVEYSGEYSVNVPENMKYPTQIEYHEKQKYCEFYG